jgi:uncharacterized membrane protein
VSYDHNLDRLERNVGRVLRTGVLLTSAALAVGLVMMLSGYDGVSRLVMTGGLVVLTAIPATRIVASLLDALRRRDQLLIVSTTVVLSVLGLLLIALRFWTT